VSALALFAGTWRRHGFRASAVKALARTMHRRVLIEGVDDDFPRAPPPRDLAMPHVARYSGFDVFAPHVDRCNRFFGELHRRRFAFHHLDVRTERYNPNGAPGCADARFPPADGDVDLVSAASLFTHLYPDGARAYAREMARVLDGTGFAAVSFHDRPETGRPFSGTEHRTDYDADAFQRIFADAGFGLVEDAGDVCGQRTLLLRKRATT